MAVTALTAVRGAIGFLSRLPVGHSEAGWDAFRRTPTAIPVVGYLLGAIISLAVLVPGPEASVAVALVAAVYLLTGVTHADGVADVGDAAVVHGDAADRREVLKDTVVGTGGVLAVVIVVLGLALAGVALASLPLITAVGVVVTAEVGAKAAIAALVCVGVAPHEGLGSALTETAVPRDAVWVAAVTLPAVLLSWPHPWIGAAVLLAAGGVAVGFHRWANRRLDGVNGDVLGATNELARVAGLHAGVIAWTLS